MQRPSNSSAFSSRLGTPLAPSTRPPVGSPLASRPSGAAVAKAPAGAADAQDVFERYGIAPLPESVVQLTRLVARRDACAEEIARVVSKDPAISKRLLRFANPRAASEADFAITTVGDALMRTGMSPVILLAMLDPLTRAVVKAFDMCKTPMAPELAFNLAPFSGVHAVGIVGFSGKATGTVHIRIEPPVAQRVAATLIGVQPEALSDEAEINDVIGELVNIVAGNLKSNLCDAGIPCTLTPPKVERSSDCRKVTIPGGVSERLGFRAADFQILVDVSVNPWTE